MADPKLVALLRENVTEWNTWMDQNAGRVRPNLRGAQLTGANLEGADLRRADLTGAYLMGAELSESYLHGADLTRAHLRGAYLIDADLSEATLILADLTRTELSGADFSAADLRSADLTNAVLVETILKGAILTGCHVYGVSAWDVKTEGAIQQDLIITKEGEAAVTVDDLEVAQFIYLLLNNEKVRHIIDAVTSKVVLILGRFTEERKAVLDAIREELRGRDFTPVLFDFDKPASKDVTGTVETLARMARFIIADLTDPSSIPHELATIVPFLRTTPVLPLRLVGSGGYSIFEDLQRAYTWVLDIHEYDDDGSLISALPRVIAPADEMAKNLRKKP